MAETITGKLFDGVLLASDFDGTLVPHTGKLTEGVKKALAFFIENGGRFTVCSGRAYLGFHAYSAEYINAPVLLANGGMAYDYERRKIVVDNGIGDEGIVPLRAVAERFPELSVEFFPFDKAYAVHLTEGAQQHFTNQGIPFARADDPADVPLPWFKVMLGGPAPLVAQAQQFLRAHVPELSFLPTTGSYLEILKKGVNKGTALLALADALGIGHAHVYAVGDGYNDVEMLQAAAKAFVPANGDAEAMACADVVVPSNEEDAVAHVIEWLAAHYAKG